ncbi:hypothetical protein T4A_13022 [Trichinella pseudospiralis]|uniref:Transmembrane protein n=1 Tax=Trichinella pseudospiralis TaxID=6337 RepID=A0A0V1DR81_TRIPS|nr:hypothetical protein T4A_13022 [Trichinella pseudospiralis]
MVCSPLQTAQLFNRGSIFAFIAVVVVTFSAVAVAVMDFVNLSWPNVCVLTTDCSIRTCFSTKEKNISKSEAFVSSVKISSSHILRMTMGSFNLNSSIKISAAVIWDEFKSFPNAPNERTCRLSLSCNTCNFSAEIFTQGSTSNNFLIWL